MENQHDKTAVNQNEAKKTKTPETNNKPGEETKGDKKQSGNKEKPNAGKSSDQGTASGKADFENPNDDPA